MQVESAVNDKTGLETALGECPDSLGAGLETRDCSDSSGPDAPEALRGQSDAGSALPADDDKVVRNRDLSVLKREASDALAALGAAHAVVSSARLAQIQTIRTEVDRGTVEQDALIEVAGDYQAWQNDQVRLFDALALVLGITVPEGSAFDQIDEEMEAAAAEHLNALTAEYQRRLLTDQFEAGPKEG